MKELPPVEERFWDRVRKTSTCWEWVGHVNRNGYGVFNPSSRKSPVMAHRFAYELSIGPIEPLPNGKFRPLDHLCRNRWCVNPDHLEPVTHRENLMRAPTLQARNARATECIHGHPFDADNTRLDKYGRRACKECKRRLTREWQSRNRKAA